MNIALAKNIRKAEKIRRHQLHSKKLAGLCLQSTSKQRNKEIVTNLHYLED